MRVRTRATMSQDDPGVPAASPFLDIINQQAKIMLKAAGELGFIPVSRPRIYGGPSAPGPTLGVNSVVTTDKNHISLDEYLASASKRPFMN
jgi:hypothetical protein